jgi:hypothetical protein
MLDDSGVLAISKLGDATNNVQEHNGKKYFVSRSGASLLETAKTESVKCFSLTQVINLLVANKENKNKIVINVLDYNHVQVIDLKRDEHEDLIVYADANFDKVYPSFPMERKMTNEDFIINVMTKFERNATSEQLLKLASNVKAEKLQTSDDDGYSQVATTKGGVVLSGTTNVKNIWELATYKTFPEVDQPVIPYVLRLHQQGGDSMPLFALYDCDGGAWKVKTTAAIREWLKLKLKDMELVEMVSVL